MQEVLDSEKANTEKKAVPRPTILTMLLFVFGLVGVLLALILVGIYSDNRKSKLHHTPAMLEDLDLGRSYRHLTPEQMEGYHLQVVQDIATGEFRLTEIDTELQPTFVVVIVDGEYRTIENAQ